MVDIIALISDPIFWVLIAFLIVLVFVDIYLIIRLLFKRREEHVGLYFEGNFRGIISEWDLVNRPTLKKWKGETIKRLSSLDKEVTSIEKMRHTIDNRLLSLDRDIVKLEKY